MTDMLQGGSGQNPQPNDDPPYERRTPSKTIPQKARGPSKRAHARKAAELLAAQLLAAQLLAAQLLAAQLLAAQLLAESIAVPDHEGNGAEDRGYGQQAESSFIPTKQEDWQPRW